MNLAAKLQLKPGLTFATLGVPESVELGLSENAHSTAAPAARDSQLRACRRDFRLVAKAGTSPLQRC